MAWPQPALENISIQISWDGEADHPANVHVTIELTSLPSSKLRLIQHEHPKVKSIEIVTIKRTVRSSFVPTVSRLSLDSSGLEDSLPSFDWTGPHRTLVNPPSWGLHENTKIDHSKLPRRRCEINKNNPRPLHRAQQQPARRKYLTSETPSGTKLAPYPRGEPTVSRADISPPDSLASFETYSKLACAPQKPPTLSPSRDIQYAKRDKRVVNGSRIALLRQAKAPSPSKGVEYSKTSKPAWRAPAVGDSIFPRGRKSIQTTMAPRRVSRSAEPRMMQHLPNRELRPCSRLMRSSSFEMPRYRDLPVQVNPQDTVALWLRNNTATWGSYKELSRHPTPVPPENGYLDKRGIGGVGNGNVLRERQKRPANTLRSSSLAPSSSSSIENSGAGPLYGIQHGLGQSDISDRVRPQQSPTFASGKAPIIQDIGMWKWAVCLPTVEEETWSVDLKLVVFLERHPHGGHVLEIPGLPQQAGDIEGNYFVKLQTRENTSFLPSDECLQDRVKLVKTPSTLEKLRNGESRGTFSLGEIFSLRFLLLERNRFLDSEDFHIEYVVHEDYRTNEHNGSKVIYNLICNIHLGLFMCWAEEVTFTLFICGSPWSGTLETPISGDITVGMGHAHDSDFDNELAITFIKRLVELSKPVKVTWTQDVGARFKRLAPSVSNRPRKYDLRYFCCSLQAPSEDPALETLRHGVATTLVTPKLQHRLVHKPIHNGEILEASKTVHDYSGPLKVLESDTPKSVEHVDSEFGDLNPYTGWDFFLFPRLSPPKIARKPYTTTHGHWRICDRTIDFLGAMPGPCRAVFMSVALVLALVMIAHLKSSNGIDFSSVLVGYRGSIANASALKNLPEEWWSWDPWQVYMKQEWDLEFVDVKRDPTGWRTLISNIREGKDGERVSLDVADVEGARDVEHGRRESGVEYSKQDLGSGGIERLEAETCNSQEEQAELGQVALVAQEKEEKAEIDTTTDGQTTKQGENEIETKTEDAIKEYPATEERGTLGKARDLADYALGWRPVDD